MKSVHLRLQPIGVEVTAAVGTPLRDLLFEHGVEFPCGGQGRCRGCKVRVLEGHASVTAGQREHLSLQEIGQGWRLACQCVIEEQPALVIELRQWDAAILADDSPFAFVPQEGLGVAVDLGTTTLVAQLLDLESGHVLAVRTALNPQARYGADVMSRVQFAVGAPPSGARWSGGQGELEAVIRKQIGTLIRQLLAAADDRVSGVGVRQQGVSGRHGSHPSPETRAPRPLRKVVLVGNTVMHHLFCGIDLAPLAHYPFEPLEDGLQRFPAADLGWTLDGAPTVLFLPCLGGFVGSDILAGVLATGLHESDALRALVDLGTNGEIVIGNRERLLCCSTAAGPAFEGARISTGMRAATGAIWKVAARAGRIECEVLGGEAPRGICGSGLVDAVAAGLELGLILPTGRLACDGDQLPLAPPVSLSQADIRQLQLAKGAIAAGIRILLRQWGAGAAEVERLYLAGAFGNYVDLASARRIGLLAFPEEQVHPSGNTALLGAKLALFSPGETDGSYQAIRRRIEHRSLSADPDFQEVYVEEMGFPAGGR